MSASKQIDWKLVKKVVGRVEFVPLEEVPTITGCLSGAVPPFGSVLGESPIPTFMDVSLQEQGDIIYFNCVREESWCDLLGLENTYIKNEVWWLHQNWKTNNHFFYKMYCLCESNRLVSSPKYDSLVLFLNGLGLKSMEVRNINNLYKSVELHIYSLITLPTVFSSSPSPSTLRARRTRIRRGMLRIPLFQT